ncbi:MAG: hypothetical protein AB8G86_06090 [Saprospiraceae bacterium]
MNLNYLAFFLIAFIPLIIAAFWYHPKSIVVKWAQMDDLINPLTLRPLQVIWAFLLSFTLVYGYINLTIHQMGFYELFFTDIMLGSEEAKQITVDFLAKYGQKYRNFGHGVFHGALNAFLFALPFVGLQALLNNKKTKYVLFHFSYWLLTSMIIGGLISEFV